MFRKSRPPASGERRITRTIRVYRKAYHEIKQAALDDETSVNALILRAIGEYLDRRKASRDTERYPG
jgi:hypothetical protein